MNFQKNVQSKSLRTLSCKRLFIPHFYLNKLRMTAADPEFPRGVLTPKGMGTSLLFDHIFPKSGYFPLPTSRVEGHASKNLLCVDSFRFSDPYKVTLY